MQYVFSGFEWILIDLASRFGKEDVKYAERIAWAENLIPEIQVNTLEELKVNLEPWIAQAKDKPHFVGAALALWDAIQGNDSNWMVSQDSASSGAQLMSCMTKCHIGMSHTGVLGEEVPDLYTSVNNRMAEQGSKLPRKVLKKGMIPHMYASVAAPKAVFREAYGTFVRAYGVTVPRAQILSDMLVDAWQSNAQRHVIVAPDGFVADMPVLVSEKKKIPFLEHRYEYIFSEIGTKVKGKAAGTKSLSANGTHIYDAYVLRELNRRCNYDIATILGCLGALQNPKDNPVETDNIIHLQYLEELSEEYDQISMVALEYIDVNSVHFISDSYRDKLIAVINQMLLSNPFKIKNVHDDFACLPNYVSHMKYIYNTLLRETYLGKWVYVVLEKLTGKKYKVSEIDPRIAEDILLAQYSIS